MGDGMGLFARTAFAVGSELVRERPLVVLADSMFEAQGEAYLTERVALLPAPRQTACLRCALVFFFP